MAAGTLGPMADPLLLLPDLLLIVCGYVICHYTPLNQPVWEGVERLVYHVLFPALLFTAIVRSPQQVADMLPLAGASLVVTVVGVALALALGHWPGVDARLHASGAQTAYRFNTYVALALSERIAGAQGLAWIALIVALSVPVTNVAVGLGNAWRANGDAALAQALTHARESADALVQEHIDWALAQRPLNPT